MASSVMPAGLRALKTVPAVALTLVLITASWPAAGPAARVPTAALPFRVRYGSRAQYGHRCRWRHRHHHRYSGPAGR